MPVSPGELASAFRTCSLGHRVSMTLADRESFLMRDNPSKGGYLMGASRSDIGTRQPLFEAYRCVRTIIDAARHGDRPSAVIHRENVCSFRQRSAANQRRHRSDFVTKWPFCLICSL